jgi:pimeloyl-ACP methyl ester carboxylesterase
VSPYTSDVRLRIYHKEWLVTMQQNALNPSQAWRASQRMIVFALLLAITFFTLSVLVLPVMAQEATEEVTEAPAPSSNTLPNIVLVHGAWADGSSWSEVIKRLQAQGYNVIAPQFSHTSLADNVAKLKQVTARLEGPILLAGHSFGGQIITAGAGEIPNAVGLVYIAAFGLDEGESIGALLAQGEPTPALAHLEIDELGFAWLPQDDFVNHFAADVDPAWANVMWATQQPIQISALEDVMGVPAWKSLPSWYMVATNDEAIPPDAERLFAQRMGATTVEVESSHVPMGSHPDEVAALIQTAAEVVAAE